MPRPLQPDLDPARGFIAPSRLRSVLTLASLMLALAWPCAAQADIHVTASGTVVTVTGDNAGNLVLGKAASFGADVVIRQPGSATAAAPCAVQSPGVVRCLLGPADARTPMTKMFVDLPGPAVDDFDKVRNPAAPDLVWDLDLDFGENVDGRDVVKLSAIGTDAVDGGPGADDLADYRGCLCLGGVTARLDGFGGDDILTEFEHLVGSGQGDRLTGRDGPVVPNPTIDDTEIIEGLHGDDTIEGLGGVDLLFGGEGDDTILAEDGERDGISCGNGVDRAVVDPIDTFDDRAACENLEVGADRDGDSLPDDWEENGYDFDGDGTADLDLRAMGADPDHKDIFVELDFMPLHDLSNEAMAMVVEAFRVAPVANPDGVGGITLHVDNGAESVMNPRTGALWGARSDQDSIPHADEFGTSTPADEYEWTAFDDVKATNFLGIRRAVFHYALTVHDPGGTEAGGISRGFTASDFLISQGTQGPEGGTDTTTRRQAKVFMHELGHNLSLRHGGADHVNEKPNYLSIMNYAYGGLLWKEDGTAVLDYSRFEIPFDESALDESAGFGFTSGDVATYVSRAYCPDGVTVELRPLRAGFTDWNCSGVDDGVVSVDTNARNGFDVLTSQTDWDKLEFDGGAVGADIAPSPAMATANVEPPRQQVDASEAQIETALAARQPVVLGGLPPAGGGTGSGPGVAAAAGGSGVVGAAAAGPVRLTGMRLTPASLRPARTGPSVVRRGGARVTFRLDRAAPVVFAVERRSGRRWVRVRGSFTRAAKAGVNTLRFSGRVAGVRLRPGRHRLVATPQGGAPVRAPFTVRR